MINRLRTEQMTALTDLILCSLAVYILFQFTDAPGFKFRVWIWIFFLLATASFLGFVAHGFAMSQRMNDMIWKPLRLSLGLALGMIVVGAVYDLTGEEEACQVLLYAPGVVALNFGVDVLTPRLFRALILMVSNTITILFALGVLGIYIFLTIKHLLPGSGWMVAGFLTTFLAVVVQAVGRKGTPIFWSFDNNGVFHLIQMAGLILIMIGLKTSF